jgi:two-component sensor histidine kinase
VDWLVESNRGRTLKLRWVEKSFPSLIQPSTTGFGTSFIQQLVSPDGGSARMTLAADGVRWDINLILRSEERESSTIQISNSTNESVAAERNWIDDVIPLS